MEKLKNEGDVKQFLFSSTNSNAIKDALSELDEVNSLLLLSLSTAVQSKLKAINIEIRDIGECCSCSQNVQSPEVF